MIRLIVFICFLLPMTAFSQPKVLILGDSLSAGYGINYEQAWVHLLEEKLRLDYQDVVVINASISGETSSGALARLPQILSDHRPDLVLIELGGNDGLRGIRIKSLKDNLQKIISMIRKDSEPLLTQMYIPLNYGKKYTKLFAEVYPELARTNSVALAPFLLEGFATNPEYMQADRIHPKVSAQPLIVENILPAIKKALAEQQVP